MRVLNWAFVGITIEARVTLRRSKCLAGLSNNSPASQAYWRINRKASRSLLKDDAETLEPRLPGQRSQVVRVIFRILGVSKCSRRFLMQPSIRLADEGF